MRSNRNRWILVFLLVSAAGGAPAHALGDYVGIEPQYWQQSLTGGLRVDGGALPGTELDIQDDLDVEENDRLASGRIWVKWLKRNYLYASTFDSSHGGSTTLATPIIFNGVLFAPGEDVSSRFGTRLTTVHYGYNFLDFKVVKLGFRVGADRLEFEGSVRSSTSGNATEASESATVPVAGLGITVQPVPLFRFSAEATGIGGTFGGNEVSFVDGRAQVEIYLNHFFGFHAGYRLVKIDVDLEDFGSADVTEKGPFLGVTIRL